MLFFRLVVFFDVVLGWEVGGAAQSLDYLVGQSAVV